MINNNINFQVGKTYKLATEKNMRKTYKLPEYLFFEVIEEVKPIFETSNKYYKLKWLNGPQKNRIFEESLNHLRILNIQEN